LKFSAVESLYQRLEFFQCKMIKTG